MITTVTYKTKDGRLHRYKLKGTEELSGISRKRKALFVVNMEIFFGYSEGEVDETGCFSIWEKPESPSMGVDVPVNMTLGWAYLRERS
ncbi:MAG: hypothetical protein IKO85_00940 [Bacteroidaceae bacterium]|nr:hypothetical protein [Bacteroidaceae bacterium]